VLAYSRRSKAAQQATGSGCAHASPALHLSERQIWHAPATGTVALDECRSSLVQSKHRRAASCGSQARGQRRNGTLQFPIAPAAEAAPMATPPSIPSTMPELLRRCGQGSRGERAHALPVDTKARPDREIDRSPGARHPPARRLALRPPRPPPSVPSTACALTLHPLKSSRSGSAVRQSSRRSWPPSPRRPNARPRS